MGETSQDRPDVVSRIFRLKLKCLLRDIIDDQFFGKVNAWMYSIEWQFSGALHAHILLILSQSDKLHTAAEYDAIVTAEMPNPNSTDHEVKKLYDLVTKFMVHSPCTHQKNRACMRRGCCRYHFPKQFSPYTKILDDTYPLYRRRSPEQGGYTFVKKNGQIIDNRWIVTYNKDLLLKYQAHMNVEICYNFLSVKYIYKYIYKAPHVARMSAVVKNDQSKDEVRDFLNSVYVCPSEACRRIFQFPIQASKPSVQKLTIHLPNHQQIIFSEQIKKKDFQQQFQQLKVNTTD